MRLGIALLVAVFLSPVCNAGVDIRKTVLSQLQAAAYPMCPRRSRRSTLAPAETALYLNGSVGLRLNPGNWEELAKDVRQNFTLSLWINLEGGQPDPSTIIAVTDLCSRKEESVTWKLEMRTKDGAGEEEVRLQLHVKPRMSEHSSSIRVNKGLPLNAWTELRISHSDGVVKLFVNGARVGILRTKHKSALFSLTESKCKRLHIGTDGTGLNNRREIMGFRGSATLLKIWANAENISATEPIFNDDFSGMSRWRVLGNEHGLISLTVAKSEEEPTISIPSCGFTVCDNPSVVNNYLNVNEFSSRKTLRMRIIVVADDNGKNPLVSASALTEQKIALETAFLRYNISWDIATIQLNSTKLRYSQIIFGCDSSNIGNGVCDPSCRHSVTGDDGGDCDSNPQCEEWRLGDGECNIQCNRAQYSWDHGDCCLDVNTPHGVSGCLDPKSPNRRYMTIEEYKELVNTTNEDALIVQFAEWPSKDLLGVSTFPWEKDIYGIQGGVLIKPERFGTKGNLNSLVHELGHILGLWHVHHGVSEVGCTDPCHENEASMLTGDLASDTRPTPKNLNCSDPSDKGPCPMPKSYSDTPFRNYMSYAGNDCAKFFSPQQVARMHCYIDLKYRHWMVEGGRNIIVVTPTATPLNNGSVKISWTSPIDDSGCRPLDAKRLDTLCSSDGRILQYAATAISSLPYQLSGFWAPEQAIGAPDAERCAASTKAWLPDVPDCLIAGRCTLTLRPELVLPIERLSLWVAWNAANGIRSVRLVFDDSTDMVLDEVFVTCDQPYTVRVTEERKVVEIQVTTNNPFVSVDAIRVETPPHLPECSHCPSLQFRLQRDPPFTKNPPNLFSHFFVDNDLKAGSSFTYRVSVLDAAGKEGPVSPPLTFYPGSNVCGDGVVDTSVEGCDDGNNKPGDGCSQDCRVEKSFRCSGSPNQCYLYEGDGVCEEGESSLDCSLNSWEPTSFFAPRNLSAFSLQLNASCSLEHLLAFAFPQGCTPWPQVWRGCGGLATSPLTVQASFVEPIFPSSILISTIVLVDATPFPETTFRVRAIYAGNKIVDLKEKTVKRCLTHPIEFAIPVNLIEEPTTILAVIVTVSDPSVMAVASVIAKVVHSRDLLTIKNCADAEMLYDVAQRRCTLDGFNDSTSCSPPRIANAECHSGYSFKDGKSEIDISCANGIWSRIPTDCNPITCPEPKIANAQVICPNATSFGSVCSFTCSSEATFVGNENEISCGSDGEWSVPEGFCMATCSKSALLLRNVSESSLQCRSHNQQAGEGYYPVGTVCRAHCLPNHHLPSSSATKLRLTCTPESNWIGGSCEQTKCSLPTHFTGTLFNCTNHFFSGSRCALKCPNNYKTRFVQCTSDGAWNGRLECGGTSRTCPVPQSSPEVIIRCPKRVALGVSCYTSCRVPGYEVVTDEKHFTSSGNEYSTFKPVLNITCTSSASYSTHPSTLLCMRSCNKEFVGDGWCDFSNNRGFCEWDGGDCCASTSRTGRVRHMFPSLCTSRLCHCIDPTAAENTLEYTISKRLRRHGSSDSGFWINTIRAELEEVNGEDLKTDHSEKVETVSPPLPTRRRFLRMVKEALEWNSLERDFKT